MTPETNAATADIPKPPAPKKCPACGQEVQIYHFKVGQLVWYSSGGQRKAAVVDAVTETRVKIWVRGLASKWVTPRKLEPRT